MDAQEQAAKEIVEGLFVPDDPGDWGTSPKSTEDLAQEISQAIRQAEQAAREQERETWLKIFADLLSQLDAHREDELNGVTDMSAGVAYNIVWQARRSAIRALKAQQ